MGKLGRWFAIHVLCASLPTIASNGAYVVHLHNAAVLHLNTGEVLFFAFMNSSIALVDIDQLYIEVVRAHWHARGLGILRSVLFLFVLFSALLYAAEVFNNIETHSESNSDYLLGAAEALAAVILVVGGVVEIVSGRLEDRIWSRRYSSVL